MHHKRLLPGIATFGLLLLCLSACEGPQYITNDPTILLDYQKAPSEESLANLSRSYLNTITQNRKTGKVQPGLYSDYAVTLYLLGKPEAAISWFNKEVATFPYTAPYVKQLQMDLEERLYGADPNRNRRYTIDDVDNMDEIALLRPTENREASNLDKESVNEASRISRDAVKGLDKPLTRAEQKALKKQQRENRRQEKAAEKSNFTAPATTPANSNVAPDKASKAKEKQETTADKTKKGLFRKKAATENNTDASTTKKGLFRKKSKATTDAEPETLTTPESTTTAPADDSQLTRKEKKAIKKAEKAQKKAAKQQEKAAKAVNPDDGAQLSRKEKKALKKEQKQLEKEEKALKKAEQELEKQAQQVEQETTDAAKGESKKLFKRKTKEQKEDTTSPKKEKKKKQKKNKNFDDDAFNDTFGAE